jgi:hypothetical protein
LDLRRTNVTAHGVESLRRMLPDCKVFH